MRATLKTVEEIMACVGGDKATREFVKTEVMKLAKDAERYRWLRENDWDSPIVKLGYDEYHTLKGDALDEAIDAAIIDRAHGSD